MNKPVRYVAELAHVREVSLMGSADPVFWKDRLKAEGLVPVEEDGKARLMVIAADLMYMGIRFRELSFSVLVSHPGPETRRDAAFLVQAFNSRGLFAFCERVFFSTPYRYGDVRVSLSPPSIQLMHDHRMRFRAEPAVSEPREPSSLGEDGWEGPVFLPRVSGRSNGPRRLFFARVQGITRTYPFRHSEDSLVIRPSPNIPVLQALVDSRFTGETWHIREDARHAKSKTYKQPRP